MTLSRSLAMWCRMDPTLTQASEKFVICGPEIPPPSSQPSHGIVSPANSYLDNPFPMFENVGINEEVLYGEDPDDDDDKGDDNGEEGEEKGNEGDDDGEHGNEGDDDGEEGEEGDDDGEEGEEGESDDWVAKDVEQYDIPKFVYDKDDPPMSQGSIYYSIEEFRVALSQHAIKTCVNVRYSKDLAILRHPLFEDGMCLA